jgi:thioredoxin reductase
VKSHELVIVGAGPAGMAAAVEAVRLGIHPLVLDENLQPGGRLLATPPPVLTLHQGRLRTPGDKLLEDFRQSLGEVDHRPSSTILGFFDQDQIAFVQGDRLQQCRYRTLIVAAGAYDRPVPLPGWTLPGVVTAGGALNFIKHQGVLPAKNVLLAGSGLLQIALAYRIAANGGKIAGIAEASTLDWFALLKAFPGNFDILAQGLKYLVGIKRRGIPIWPGYILTRVDGGQKVESATISKVDSGWRPIAGTQRTIPVDGVCVGYGLVPSTEITRMLGCEHQYDLRLGGWVPVRNQLMETSCKGVYAAGDCAGISGGANAILEGTIGAMSAASMLGKALAGVDERRRNIIRRLSALKLFTSYVQEAFSPRHGLFELPDEETVICRCEELTLRDIRTALSDSPPDINDFKRSTRTAMGRCQGRMCGPFIQEILGNIKGVSPGKLGPLHIRPPIKPIQLGSIRQSKESN